MKKLIQILSLLILFSSCSSKRLNERLSLWRNDKIPYGTKYSYDQLKFFFPNAEIEINNRSPVSNGFYDAGSDSTSSAMIAVVPTFMPNDAELRAIMHYASAGNHVLISAFEVSQNVRDSLKFSTKYSSGYYNSGDSMTLNVIHPVEDDTSTFIYPGRSLDNAVVSLDSKFTRVLGFNSDNEPDFIRFDLKSGGSIMIHFAPLAFSNFFLLHKKNSEYYDQVISYIPVDVNKIYWDDYYRYFENGKKKGSDEGKNIFSKLGVFLKDDILRWALYLTAILFALIYLFDSKRKQRVIPPVKQLSNASLDFVKTVGRLYFQQRDNRDLMEKLQVQFQDNLRSRYNVKTGIAQEDFAKYLSYRTGYEEASLKRIQDYFMILKDEGPVEDFQLFGLHTELEKFYKHS
ncbi:MAG: hypothetical protein ACXWV5_06590 [Flavitalea sp.]